MEKPSRTIGNLFGLLKTKSVIEDHVQNPRALSPFAVAENEARAKNRNTNDGILKLYNENPHLNNAVDLISMAVSQVDWYACDKDGNEIESEALDVLRKPNASMSRVAMFALDQTYHETLGEYFWVAARSANGKVFGFDVVAPFHVVELPTQAKRKYKIQSGKSVVEIPSDDVIHFKRINPSNPYGRGIGIAYTLGDEIDCDELSARHIKGVLNNNAIPKALVTLEGANADELARFADEFRDKNRTGDRQGRTHFVGGTIKADVKLLEHSFGDLKLLELRQYSSEVIRKTYKIPPELMGNVDNSNRATIDRKSVV